MNPEEIPQGPSFKPWCVRAIQTGLKSQTRRPCKQIQQEREWPAGTGWELCFHKHKDGRIEMGAYWPSSRDGQFIDMLEPRYKKGQIYYVREALRAYTHYHHTEPTAFYVVDDNPVMRSDGHQMKWRKRNGEPYQVDKLPAMYMRREAARYFIRITDVRVEEYGEISEEDAMAEGIDYHPDWFEEILETADPGDASRFFNEIVLPGIHDPVPNWLFAYQFEVFTREEVENA